MAFWIVYQGDSWKRAKAGGYLWAPQQNEKGRTQFYWANMEAVRPGDLIFAGVDNALRAVAQAPEVAYTAPPPDKRDEERWHGDGWRLDVNYTDLPTPLAYADWVPAVLPEMPQLYAPFATTGRPNQGYLFALPNSVGDYLVERCAERGIDLTDLAQAAAPPAATQAPTERAALIAARVGQGKFRTDLFTQWNGMCPLSKVTHPKLLRASHIKPWSSSDNAERLDPANGLLLSVAYDAAFDAKLISFADDGALILAADFPVEAAIAAGVNPAARLVGLSGHSRFYLAEHRVLMLARAARAS